MENDKKSEDIANNGNEKQEGSLEFTKAIYEIDAKKVMSGKPLKINKNVVITIVIILLIAFFGIIIYYSDVQPKIIDNYNKHNGPPPYILPGIRIVASIPSGFSTTEDSVTGHFSRKDGSKIILRSRSVRSLHDENSMYPDRFTCVFYEVSLVSEFNKNKEKYIVDTSVPAKIGNKEGAYVVLNGESGSHYQKITAACIKQLNVIYEAIVLIKDEKNDLSTKEYDHLFGSIRPISGEVASQKPEVEIINKSDKSEAAIAIQ